MRMVGIYVILNIVVEFTVRRVLGTAYVVIEVVNSSN